MSHALNAYRQSTTNSMTRIDMLIGLYAKTLSTFDDGIQALQNADTMALETAKIQAYRCLLALLDGIDVERGELAENFQRLCMYSIRLVRNGEIQHWQAAQRIIERLHNSFVQIRDKAVELEVKGEIPPLDFMAVFDEAIV